jgi:hypothetical protein
MGSVPGCFSNAAEGAKRFVVVFFWKFHQIGE